MLSSYTQQSAQSFGFLFAVSLISHSVTAWSDSNVHLTILPTALNLEVPPDDSSCRSLDLGSFFDPPRPSGHLLEYIEDYGDELIQLCHLTRASPDEVCFPSKERWCQFTKVAPTYVLSDYSTYGSQVSSWWAAKSSAAVALASRCSYEWFDAAYQEPGAAAWLNDTIMFAACHVEADWDAMAARASDDDGLAVPGMRIRQPGAEPTIAP